MELRKLEEHIRTLSIVPEMESPLISCYLDLSVGVIACREELEARMHLLRKSLPVRNVPELEQCSAKIEAFLDADLLPGTRGLAIFVRAGDQPFWLALQFEVALPTWIAAGATPNIYHLVELKDNYDRYVILLTTERSARIIGVNLGSVTAQLWRRRPELRRRVGREWSKDHYQDHRRERTRQFLHDQIRTLDQVLSAGGYGHVILAGSPRVVAALRKELPKRVAEKVIDYVPASRTDDVCDIVASTLQAFLEFEETESEAIADRLITQIRTHGLAVAGARASLEAIASGRADILVVVKAYDPGQAWECERCRKLEFEQPRPDSCPQCRSRRFREFDVKGELVRLAEQRRVAVEVVEHSDALVSLGGVGCLLRYAGAANYLYSAA